MHVQQQQIGPLAARHRDRLAPVARHHDTQAGADAQHRQHDLDVQRVVVGVQHGVQAVEAGERTDRCTGFGGDLEHRIHRRGGQADAKAAAHALLAAHFELAAHRLNQAMRDHQADAGAVDRSGFGAEPVEGLEQVRELLGRHAETGVAHLDFDARGVGRGPPADNDRAAAPLVLDGVADQVDQHLPQPQVVGAHLPGHRLIGPVRLDAYLHLAIGRQRADQRQRLVDRERDRDRVERQRHAAALDAREVEHIVDHRQQLRFGVLNVTHPFGLRRFQRRSGVHAQQLREAEHRVLRSAELVAHARQDLVRPPAAARVIRRVVGDHGPAGLRDCTEQAVQLWNSMCRRPARWSSKSSRVASSQLISVSTRTRKNGADRPGPASGRR